MGLRPVRMRFIDRWGLSLIALVVVTTVYVTHDQELAHPANQALRQRNSFEFPRPHATPSSCVTGPSDPVRLAFTLPSACRHLQRLRSRRGGHRRQDLLDRIVLDLQVALDLPGLLQHGRRVVVRRQGPRVGRRGLHVLPDNDDR